MDNRRYEVIGNNYFCMSLNAESVTACVSNYLASGRKISQRRKAEMGELQRWATKAEVGEYLIRDEYTVRVHDAEDLKKESKKRMTA